VLTGTLPMLERRALLPYLELTWIAESQDGGIYLSLISRHVQTTAVRGTEIEISTNNSVP
jgi:hypothetical protein